MIQAASQAAVHTETPQPRDRSLDPGLGLDPDPGRRASWHRAPNQEFLPLRNTSVLMLSSICHPETNEPGTRSEKKAPLAQNRKPSGQKSADEHNSWITNLVILSKLVETFHPSSLSPSLMEELPIYSGFTGREQSEQECCQMCSFVNSCSSSGKHTDCK